MKLRKKRYQHFILQSVGFGVIATVIGAVSSGTVNLFTHAGYIQSFLSMFSVLSLLVAMSVKRTLEREYGSFCCLRKDMIRIHVLSDLFLAMVEALFLGAMVQVANSSGQINQALRLLDQNEILATVPVWQDVVFLFLLVLAVQSIVTFDFMCNRGALQSFVNVNQTSGRKGLKEGSLGLLVYMCMVILSGLAIGIFTQTETEGIRTKLLWILLFISPVFYGLAAVKAKRKQFEIQNV